MLRLLLLLAAAARAAAKEQRIIFAAGCFWSVELAYQRVPGVLRTSVVYAGGRTRAPVLYEQVTTGRTGHAEAVEVVYDDARVGTGALVDLFWELHDATSLNRQGGDVGTQYRSAIWYYSDEQEEAVRASRRKHEETLAGCVLQDRDGAACGGRGYSSKIVTEIARAGENFVVSQAEEYHQQYLEKGGQDATVGSLAPIQCYGNRGPIKQMDKPKIREVLRAHEL